MVWYGMVTVWYGMVWSHLGSIWPHFWSIWGSVGINFEALGGHCNSISETLGSEGVKGYLVTLPWEPFESYFGDLLVHFFETGLCFCFFRYVFGVLTKWAKMIPKKGLPGGPQEGTRLDGSSIFTVVTQPKKGSKKLSKMERFGSQSLHYTPFWSPMYRK